MRCNVGGADRALRWALAVVFLVAGFVAPVDTGWKIVLFVLAAIALVTAALAYCPLNQLLGIDTCRNART